MTRITTQQAAPSQQLAVQSRPLPDSLRRALADPFAFGDGPATWTLPDVLPPVDELKAGLEILKAQTAAVAKPHAAFCLAKLVTAFQAKWDDPETARQLSVWLEANGDLPNDLWTQATRFLMQNHKFGMPKPAHMRDVVETIWKARKLKLARLLQMMGDGGKPAAVQREPIQVRLRTLIDSGRRWGRHETAAKAERELAALEQRSVEAWALSAAPVSSPASRDAFPVKPDTPEMQRRLLPARIRARAALMGPNHPGVLALKAELAALVGEPVVDEPHFEPEVV